MKTSRGDNCGKNESARKRNIRHRCANLKQYFFSPVAIHLEVMKFNEFHLFIVDETASQQTTQHQVFPSLPTMLQCRLIS